MRDAALDKRGEDFTVIDVGGRTILADTFAIVTGRSKVQTRVIVHVFTPEQREFYNVERLWAEVAKRQAQSS